MIRRIIDTVCLRVTQIEMDGYAIAGNWRRYEEAAARECVLLANLRPIGSNEPRDDDDEDGHDDDLKVQTC